MDPQIQEEIHGFCPGCKTVDHLFMLVGLLEGSWLPSLHAPISWLPISADS